MYNSSDLCDASQVFLSMSEDMRVKWVKSLFAFLFFFEGFDLVLFGGFLKGGEHKCTVFAS